MTRSLTEVIRKYLAVCQPAGTCREYLDSVARDEDRVFELRGEASVDGDRRPIVVEDLNLVRADVDHRFDGERHSCAKALTFATFAVVRNLRFVVEFSSDAVPDEIFDDRATVSFGEILNGGTD